jgi:hypothetical protein
MYETVTVDEALSRGKKQVNLPVFAILIILPGTSIGAQLFFELSAWIIAAGVISGFILAWLYWSFAITKWRVWAFENVRNVHELKMRAIKEKLIWTDGSIFEKTEIRTRADKQKLAALAYKFNKADIFTDDITMPAETRIYFSKPDSYGLLVYMVLAIAGAVYLFLTDENTVAGIALFTGIYCGYQGFKQVADTKPQIILSNDGIQTASTPFCKWEEITDEDVLTKSSGNSNSYYFVYGHPNGSERFEINELAVSAQKLESLMRLYRGRNNKKNQGS